MNRKSVVIIGGGLGGLFTGAILTKEGLKVTILEKNSTVGGGLQSFKRFGQIFDTGMHVIGGMMPGGNIRKICNYLGILDKVEVKDVDDDCTDKLYFAEDQKYYIIAKGRENFITTLTKQFPDEEEGIRNYVDAIYRIVNEVDLFFLKPSESYVPVHSEEFFMAANRLIEKYVANRKLRSVLSYMNPLYGGRGDETPAFIHAIINYLYITGASRFVDGSYKFADLLSDVICSNGGEVKTSCAVQNISVEDREVQYVETTKGERYTADYYISAIHPCALLKLMDEKTFPKPYRTRLNTIPNSYSAFSLYIKLKPNTFRYINHSEYYMTKYDEIWNFGRMDKPWPLGFLVMTPPESNQGEYSNRILVTAPMSFEMVRKWENTSVGHRGEEYEAWKKTCEEKLLDMIEEIHPNFKECIEAVNTSSPLTIRDFYNVKEGSLCGYSKDCNNIILSQVPVVTKVRNLLLTGQNNNLHGFCGVPLTAISTSEVILGKNYVLHKINECREK